MTFKPTYLSLLLLLAGCGHESSAPETGGGESDVWVSLTVKVPGITRANPAGGEDGDGPETGIWKENDIEDINIFFFHDPEGKGLEADAKISASRYLDNSEVAAAAAEAGYRQGAVDNVCVYKFKLRKSETPGEGDRIVVAANCGPIGGITTVGQLRDATVDKSWTPSAAGVHEFSQFAMSNALPSDGVISLQSGDGTRDKPFQVEVSVERTAARIDFMYLRSNVVAGDASALRYAVKDDSGLSAGDVYVTHLLPVNVMQKGSYILKHVTAEGITEMDPSACKMCGTEYVDADGRPSNSVVESTTTAKGLGKYDTAALYGSTRAEAITPSVFTATNGIAGIVNAHNWSVAEQGYDYDMNAVVGYANENTHAHTLRLKELSTGLAIRAVYVPHTVYSDAAASATATGYGYIPGTSTTPGHGKTFWRYSPTDSRMAEKDCLYFDNEAAALAYSAAHEAERGVVQKFADGICYYNLWLRHAGDEDSYDRPMPMEFVTVRSNIYRVGISFTGTGTPGVDIRDPYNIRTRIFVKPWLLRRVEDIIL